MQEGHDGIHEMRRQRQRRIVTAAFNGDHRLSRDAEPGSKIRLGHAVLRAQMKRLNAAGVVHMGYGPDDFLKNRPDTTVLRDVMSVQSTLRTNQGMLG